jgi:outer membrane protein assembly factor BamD (BamD/ComL family)
MKLNNFFAPPFTVFAVFCIALSCLTLSCASQTIVVPDNLTTMELIQRAQEASDKNRYTAALQYYTALIERYPFDIENICAAEYEIAFIHYKQKKYGEAKNEFNDLLKRYHTPDEELLPQQYKILSHIVLSKIEDIEESRRKDTRQSNN